MIGHIHILLAASSAVSVKYLLESFACKAASYLKTPWYKVGGQKKGMLIHAKYRDNHGTQYRSTVLTLSGNS